MGCGLLVLLVGLAGPGPILATLRRVSPGWVALLSGLAVGWLALGALNIWLLLRRLTPVTITEVARAYVTGWTLSLFVPGQLGDAGQVLLLRRAGIPMASSGAAYLLDKAVSLGWLGLVGLYGLGRYGPPGVLIPTIVVLAAGALVLAGLVRLASSRAPRRAWVRRFADLLGDVMRHSRALRDRPLAIGCNLAVTVLKWIVMGGLFLAAFRALHGEVSFPAAATIPVVGSLVGYLPITIAGIGTAELTAILLFERIGVGAPIVLSAYLLLRVLLALWAVLMIWALGSARSTRPAA